MKKGNIEGREPKSGRRIKGVGALTVSVVLFMLVSLIMPTVSAAPAPDLFVDPLDLSVGPEPLVEGVPATVSFVVNNMGDQSAFSLNISLYDHGELVADKWFRDCIIGENITDTLPWTPQAAGTYDLTIRAWYGPGSTKTDQNWDDNNGSVSVTVRSRPDVYLTSSDITHTAPDPDYVVDGDLVTVRAVLHNAGTADVTSCNVTLWEAAVDGGGERVATLAAITIPGSGQVTVNLPWNTTGFSGKRNLYVRVTDVLPTETAFANNVATISIKVHTVEDKVFDGVDREIISSFKIQFFITVKGGGTLTITDVGNATVYQDYGEQYEIEVMDTGKLIIDGGILNAAMNYTVSLTDSAELHLLNGAESNVRVVASGNAKVFIHDSTLDAPTIEMTGGALTASGSNITAGRLDLFYTTVVVDSSSIRTGETIRIVGQTASFNDTEIKVAREFEDIVLAIEAFPQLEGHDPDTREVEILPPALVVTDGAMVDLRNVSVDSTIYITSEESSYWTSNRLDAEGRTSVVNVHRYVVVQVRDWFGEVVPNAEVQVMDYFDDIVIISGTTNLTGDVTLAVKTDYVTAAQKPYVGNLRVRASAYGRNSDDVWFAHSKYPDMDFESNTLFVDIEMPPNPHPDMGLRYRRYVTPHLIKNDESSMDKNIIVDNTVLTLLNTTFTLEQEFPYQWYILITGEHGTLRLQNATIMSQYPFKIYVEESGTLVMSEGSALLDVRIIAKDDSSLEIVDGIIMGGIFTECQSIDIAGASRLTLSHTHMEATTVSITGGYVHEQADMLIKANDVMLSGVELSADYEISDTVGAEDLWDITLYFGWSILNDEEYLLNISAGFFDYFAAGSEITIETSRLNIIDSFVYAIDTNIKVRRSSTPKQTSIEGSWIGGINLTVISDDMVAIDSHFNRVLDNFSGTDKIRLESVEVPGIVCEGEALVERYWSLTVYAYDGAGSVRPWALLEVFSTETNDRVFPPTGEEDLESSRTNSAGMITVSLLANVTDSTGDYFVGSYYFWLVYDGPNFENDPAYTETKQVNLKGDSVFEARWPIVIAPLEKDIIYCLYTAEEAGPSVDIKMYNHTFWSEEEAEQFLNESAYMSYDRIKFNRTIIRNTTIRMTFYASARVNEVWEPLTEGTVKVYVLTTPDPNPNRPATDYNGTALIYTVEPHQLVDGMGNITISIPNGVSVYQLYIAIAGGDYDPIFEPITERFMDLEVKHPQTIQITSAKIQEYPIHVGDAISIMGSVRYIYTDEPVLYAEIEVTGTYVTPGRGLTNMDGGFTISMQAPLQPQENVSLEIIAVDPISDEQSAMIINYAVEPPYEAEDVVEFPWGWVIVGIIAAVIAFSIVLGAVMMYRKHYGEVVECGECGAFIPSSATSCPKCGIEFETDLARCSECEAWIPAKSSSCPVCGTPFTIQSLEEAVAMEEAEEDVAPIDQLTTSTAQLAPLTLEGSTQASKWGDKVEKRRRRIKKRVKKRLTVTDAEGNLEEEAPEEAKDLFVGDEGDEATRLPGLGVDESMLSDDELSRLLPTEDMLKELMLTSDQPPSEAALEGEADELADELADEEAPEADEAEADADADADADAMEAGMDLEEIPSEEGEVPEPDAEDLEEIPPPEGADDDLDLPEDEETMPGLGQVPDEDKPEEEMYEGRELLSELGLVAEVPSTADRDEGGEPAEEESLKDLLTEEGSKETPKLCPNCGGNWILYKDGEYTCRICGEKW